MIMPSGDNNLRMLSVAVSFLKIGFDGVFPQERVRGFEPPTYSLGSCHSAN